MWHILWDVFAYIGIAFVVVGGLLYLAVTIDLHFKHKFDNSDIDDYKRNI